MDDINLHLPHKTSCNCTERLGLALPLFTANGCPVKRRRVSDAWLKCFLCYRSRQSWSTSSAGSSTAPSSPTASPGPAESWSSRCPWWSGWKVGTHPCPKQKHNTERQKFPAVASVTHSTSQYQKVHGASSTTDRWKHGSM